MLYLRFFIGRDRYIISANYIVSILPLLKMHKLNGVPDYMVGYINYRGTTIPVVDISKLLRGKKSKSRMSTRIVLIDYVQRNRHVSVGIIAEQATEVVKLEQAEFTPNVIDSEAMPYLGSIAKDTQGILQLIDIQQLIDLKVRDYLDCKAA